MLVWIVSALIAVLAWLFLLLARHDFWRAQPRLETGNGTSASEARRIAPPVAAIIPARDEAEVIGTAVRSLFAQDYPGRLDIVVVDDQSRDGTSAVVDALIPEAGAERSLARIGGTDRPDGWSGKLWALKAGLDHLADRPHAPTVLLLTDADIAHDPANLSALSKKMVNEDRDLVSVMVRLRNRSFWERLLIPPFVFFFQMLYPFAMVNRPDRPTAAAAGGCVLLRSDALRDAGGIETIKGALIDDVTLGRLIKRRPNGRGRIWLGHAERTVSLRAYEELGSIWRMVVRTADTQLGHSLVNLAGTLTGMTLIYVMPPLAVLAWPLHQDVVLGLSGLAGWALMSLAYLPTLGLYRSSALWAPTLPLAALLYAIMTIDSARRFRQGEGGVWKGRRFDG